MPLAYSFCRIHSCTISGRWRSEIPAHPGVPKCSHWGTEKRECKDSETIWTPGIMFLVELECCFLYVVPNCDWEGACIQLVLELEWEAVCPTWSWISRMGVEEKELPSTCLLWWGVLHHKHFRQLAVGQRPASELCAHSLRLWCFLKANRLLLFT